MSKRKRIPRHIEAEILLRSGRRCCLCYGLQGDFQTKQGQIAHIDHDASNSSASNLVFLCLFHHDAFDSTPRQSKRITQTEVLLYRDLLYTDVAKHLPRLEDFASPASMSKAASEMHDLIGTLRKRHHYNGTLLNSHEIDMAVRGDILRITPYDRQKLDAGGYTLSLGEQAIVNGVLIHMDAKYPVSLSPGDSALVVTQEIVGLPLDVLGKLFPLTSAIRLGLVVHCVGRVAPGFQGRLTLPLEQTGPDACVLPLAMHLAVIEFTLLALPPEGKTEPLI